MSQVWWRVLGNLAIGKRKRGDWCKFEASLVYIWSLRLVNIARSCFKNNVKRRKPESVFHLGLTQSMGLDCEPCTLERERSV